MEPLVTKTELLSRLEREYARLAAVLASLTAEQWTVRGGIGSWSVKDMLAHVIAHQERAREELRYAIRGERLEIDHSAVDAFNAQAAQTRKTDSVAVVLAAWHDSYQQLVSLVEGLSEADFSPTSALAQALDDTIDGALGNNTYEHYAEHRAEIEAWLRGVSNSGGDEITAP